MNKRIVIVEDDEFLARYYRRLLERDGHQTWAIGHALGAIDLIDNVEPDVIMLDVLLIGTTGFSLLHELQSHVDLANIPVILVTGIADNIDIDVTKRYGVKHILNKQTMHPNDICRAVQIVS
ncbi:MAG: response regulator [Candidatus Saccharimonadales bacterium]